MNADESYMNIRFETLQQAQDDLGAAFAAIQATMEITWKALIQG